MNYIIFSKCKFEVSVIVLRSKKTNLAVVAYVIEKSLFVNVELLVINLKRCKLNNSMEQSFSWEANSSSSHQDSGGSLQPLQKPLTPGLVRNFVTWQALTARNCKHDAETSSWRIAPSWLSATAYWIYSQPPTILKAFPPSATWGPALLWWEGSTYNGEWKLRGYNCEYYVYWNVHHLDSWVKRGQLDVTCFSISLFNAQHVSDVNTSILRSLRPMCWVISGVVLIWFDVCWCYVVVWLWWCGIRMQAEALVLVEALMLQQALVLQPAYGYHTTTAIPQRNTSTHRTRSIQPMK